MVSSNFSHQEELESLTRRFAAIGCRAGPPRPHHRSVTESASAPKNRLGFTAESFQNKSEPRRKPGRETAVADGELLAPITLHLGRLQPWTASPDALAILRKHQREMAGAYPGPRLHFPPGDTAVGAFINHTRAHLRGVDVNHVLGDAVRPPGPCGLIAEGATATGTARPPPPPSAPRHASAANGADEKEKGPAVLGPRSDAAPSVCSEGPSLRSERIGASDGVTFRRPEHAPAFSLKPPNPVCRHPGASRGAPSHLGYVLSAPALLPFRDIALSPAFPLRRTERTALRRGLCTSPLRPLWGQTDCVGVCRHPRTCFRRSRVAFGFRVGDGEHRPSINVLQKAPEVSKSRAPAERVHGECEGEISQNAQVIADPFAFPSILYYRRKWDSASRCLRQSEGFDVR
ncbi:hypothetical protein SKAU_G00347810 [Synaphobranchus kaupii]|uniref:Uncharacterized protein n=1 Tax=Synaphobranchus kaupii TaxID=118154 RepID=A0A9Q1EJW1_SYNKA|nr:hypothetical protein SKAU_G00347810 [Synaphobranchus kaupii]